LSRATRNGCFDFRLIINQLINAISGTGGSSEGRGGGDSGFLEWSSPSDTVNRA
jgi:hypothetical protein